jgi:pilus assembly protein Flp/PilA
MKEKTMKKITSRIVDFLKEEDGPTAVEYAVMLALIVVVCLTAIANVGTAASGKFRQVSTTISN